MFNEEKVAQMAGYFLLKRGGQMNLLKLMKLLYLSDRESMNRYDVPMSNDMWYSMDNGPVLSQTYNLMNGSSDKLDDGWNRWISGRANYQLSLKFNPEQKDFTELSQADITVLDSIYEKFGHENRWDLAKYTHDNCPEWQDPHGGSIKIEPSSVFKALGRTKEQTETLSRWLNELDELEQITCRMR